MNFPTPVYIVDATIPYIPGHIGKHSQNSQSNSQNSQTLKQPNSHTVEPSVALVKQSTPSENRRSHGHYNSTEGHLYAMPDALDQVWEVLPQGPLVHNGSRHALSNLHLSARREIPDSDSSGHSE